MDTLLSILLFTAMFSVMMRFGCGAHMGGHHAHGGHRPHDDAPSRGHLERDTDPVCGMTVPGHAGFAAMHDGEEYRFCSVACLDKFEASPRQYTKRAA